MLIISRTPVRISFFGGGTDYPAFYHEHQGAVLGTTIDQYTYISVKTLKSAFFDHNIRIAYSKTELVKDVNDIEHPSIRECLKYRGLDGKIDIHIFSDLPARTGLGSSSSFSLEQDVFPLLLKKRAFAYPSTGKCIDIGTKESCLEAQSVL